MACTTEDELEGRGVDEEALEVEITLENYVILINYIIIIHYTVIIQVRDKLA